MRKLLLVCILILALAGCNSGQEFETVMDVYQEPIPASAGEMYIQIPSDASIEVFEGENSGTLYLCEGYDLVLQTLEAGDLQKTLKQISGYPTSKLTVIETLQDSLKRVDCVWSAAGEGGEQIVRAAVLDDGTYHYVLMAMADASKTVELQEVWREIFDTFTVINTAA